MYSLYDAASEYGKNHLTYIDYRYIEDQHMKGEVFMAVDKSLISGSTAMLILKLLEEKDYALCICGFHGELLEFSSTE